MEHGKTLISRIKYPCANSHPGTLSATICIAALVASDALSLVLATCLFGHPDAWPDAEFLKRFDFQLVVVLTANLFAMLRELREVLGTLALAGACELALRTLHGGEEGMRLTVAAWWDTTLPW